MNKLNLPAAYANMFDHYETSSELETLYLYRAQVGNDINAPLHVFIFDYELCEHQLDEYSLVYMKTVQGYGVYEMTNEGAMFIGYGPTKKVAQAFAYYQALRNDFWQSPIEFIPSIAYGECVLLDDHECIPTALMTEELYEEEAFLTVDDVYSVEYAPNQWMYHHDFILCLELLNPHVPSSWRLH